MAEIRAEARPLKLAVLAAIGLAIASYLAAFQWGLVRSAWDPLFGAGSDRVLTSGISRLLPVPDASLGAAAYALDLVLALAVAAHVGPRAEVVRLLAAVTSLAALAAVVLALLQPLVARALCSLCLVSAAISIVLALGALAEARDLPHRTSSEVSP